MTIGSAVDALGKPLAVGTKVNIPAVIISISNGTYQAVIDVQTEYTDSPTNGSKTTISGLSSRQAVTLR